MAWGWLAYVAGTVIGFYFGYRFAVDKVATATIDSLIEQGYLRSNKKIDGEIEVLKWNDDK